MKIKNKVLLQAVLAGTLAFSQSTAVWAAEGVDQPFENESALEQALTATGKVTINGSGVTHLVKGIYVSEKNFDYQAGPINLDISGFGPSANGGLRSSGIFVFDGEANLNKLDLKFVDTPTNESSLEIYGIETFGNGKVKVADGSKILVDGNSSEYTKGIYAGSNAGPGPSTVTVGDNLTIHSINHNETDGWAYGMDSFDGSKIVIGNNAKINVASKNKAKGIEVGQNDAKASLGTDAEINVTSKDYTVGVNVFEDGTFEAGAGLKINASTTDDNGRARGVIVKEANAKAIINGASITAKAGTELGQAILAASGGEFVGNAGKYEIVGDINATDDSKISLVANAASKIKGAITTLDTSKTTISILAGSEWKMTGSSTVTNLTNDNSVIDMREDGKAFNSLTVENLSGTNGMIKMDIDAKNNTNNSDQIYVTNTFTGTQYLDIYDVNGYTPVGNEGVGTVLASVKDGDGKFLAKDGEGTLYWNRYELDKKATADVSGNYTTDWYLKGVEKTVDPTTSVKAIMSAINYHTWRNENDKLLKRMGELRLNGEETEGIWVRMQGAKIGRDGNYNFKNNYKSYELGYDQTVLKTDAKTRYVGGAFTYTDGNSSYESGNGDNSSKSLSLYATEIGAKGHYIDIVLKASTMDNDFKVYDSHNKKITGDMNNKGVSLSAEYGRKNKLENGWYYEPQAQLTLGRLSGDDYTTSNGVKVDQSSINTAVARMGINVGKEIGNKGIVYAKVNLLHEFAGDYDVTMRSGSDRLSKSESFNDTWFEYGIGAAFTTSKNSQVYFDVERSSGSDFTKDWQWNVGARWTF